MSKRTNVPVLGLVTSQNEFSEAPAGSLSRAEDVLFNGPNVLVPRPGFQNMSGNFGVTTERGRMMAFYRDQVYVLSDLNKLYRKDVSSTSDFTLLSGTFPPPTSGSNRLFLGARSLYLTSLSGTHVVHGPTAQPSLAGNSQGVVISAFPNESGSWFAPDSRVAYRYTVCSLDDQGRVIEGVPSGRHEVVNDFKVAATKPPATYLYRNAHMFTASFQAQPFGQFDPTETINGFSLRMKKGFTFNLDPGETNFPATSVYTVRTGAFYAFGSDIEGEISPSPGAGVASSTVIHRLVRNLGTTVTCCLSPTAISGSNFVRVYRTDCSPGADVSASEEYFLCYESPFLSSSQITGSIYNGFASGSSGLPYYGFRDGMFRFNDICPVESLGDPLYTNPASGEGLGQENGEPPIAIDATIWNNRAWYAYPTYRQELQLDLLVLSDTLDPNVQAWSFAEPLAGNPTYFKLGGITFITSTAADVQTYPPRIYNFGATPIIPDHLEQTARQMVWAINRVWNSNFDAFYTSGEDDPAGRMLIRTRKNEDPAFTWTSNVPGAWEPTTLSGSFLTSSADSFSNRLAYSKVGIPEAVPYLNHVSVGSADSAIVRIMGLNDRLYVFKTDGIYALSDLEPFYVRKISEARLVAHESLAILEERLYAETNQGIMQVAGDAVRPISKPVDDGIQAMFGSNLSNLNSSSFACADEALQRYILMSPSGSNDQATSGLVWNSKSQGFTRINLPVRNLTMQREAERLWALPIDDNRLLAERNTRTGLDFRDRDHSGSFNSGSISGWSAIVKLNDPYVPVRGDVLSSSTKWKIVSVQGSTPTFTLALTGSTAFSFSSGSAFDLWTGIPSSVTFNPITLGLPTSPKRNLRTAYLLRNFEPLQLDASFISEHTSSVLLSVPASGSKIVRVDPLPKSVVNSAQLKPGLDVMEAGKGWTFLGLVHDADLDGET